MMTTRTAVATVTSARVNPRCLRAVAAESFLIVFLRSAAACGSERLERRHLQHAPADGFLQRHEDAEAKQLRGCELRGAVRGIPVGLEDQSDRGVRDAPVARQPSAPR